MTFAERFGRNLAAAREPTGLSQEDLGLRAGLHRTAVGQLERGQRIARADTVVKLAGSLGIEPSELLAGLAWQPTEIVPGGWLKDCGPPGGGPAIATGRTSPQGKQI